MNPYEKLHFDDLTQITAPIFFLDDDTYTRLRNHKGPIEILCHDGWRGTGTGPSFPALFRTSTYRAQPAPLTKPSVDWSHVAEGFDWIARDKDGVCRAFTEKPDKTYHYWCSVGIYTSVNAFASFDSGTCDWEDSLIRRPK